MGSSEDSTVTSSSQANIGRKRPAFDVLSGSPQPTRSCPGSRGNSARRAWRLYSWYYQHFELADGDFYPASATDMYGNSGRLSLMMLRWYANGAKTRRTGTQSSTSPRAISSTICSSRMRAFGIMITGKIPMWSLQRRWTGMIEADGACEGLGQPRGGH
jgi:hypothetical protein